MKKIFVYLISVFILAISCDKIEEPYMVVQNNNNNNNNNNGNDSDVVVKKILLEDFTGHKCVNCPQAHKIAHDLLETHGVKLHVLAIHAGFFSNPDGSGNYTNDYRTSAGTTLNSYFSIGSYPIGLINRIPYNNNVKIFHNDWPAAIQNLITGEPEAQINITNTYNSSNRELNAEIKIKTLKALNGQVNLCVFLVEDSIISYQKNNDTLIGITPDIPNYVHMHMMRGAINSVWGDSLSTNIPINTEFTKTYSYVLPSVNKPKDCSVLAFLIYFNASREVIQCEVKKLY